MWERKDRSRVDPPTLKEVQLFKTVFYFTEAHVPSGRDIIVYLQVRQN